MESLRSRKSRIKLYLLLVAFMIAGVTLWYTNQLANTIAAEEEQKVKVWAEAIKEKATLVKFTNSLFKKLSDDERRKVYHYSQATHLIVECNENDFSFNFLLEILQSNENIPVIQTDENGVVKNFRNIENPSLKVHDTLQGELLKQFTTYPPIEIKYDKKIDRIYYIDSKIFSDLKLFLNSFFNSFISEIENNTSSLPVVVLDEHNQVVAKGNVSESVVADSINLQKLIGKMKEAKTPLEIDLGDGIQRTIYYMNSSLIKKLKWYPIILILVLGVFIFVSYYIFSTSRDAEQNLVWVGMAKETAHQLGTPISSLSAWLEYMKERENIDPMDLKIISEVEKDVNRLSLISDRFSKIGATPKLEKHNVYKVIKSAVSYIKSRVSKKVAFELEIEACKELTFLINVALFDWVIENIMKNAIDAMEGKGVIKVRAEQRKDDIIIEIEDNGKGIPPNQLNHVFDAGFSSKKRGWGLGLTLCKRIIENYFKGKIYVKSSEVGKGTTFAIEIPV